MAYKPNKKDEPLTAQQIKAVELLALGGMQKGEIASEVGVCPDTLRVWRKDPKFMHAVVLRSRQLLKESLPDVYKKLSEKSVDGSHHHMKILLDHLEKLEEAKASQTTITFTWTEENKDG